MEGWMSSQKILTQVKSSMHSSKSRTKRQVFPNLSSLIGRCVFLSVTNILFFWNISGWVSSRHKKRHLLNAYSWYWWDAQKQSSFSVNHSNSSETFLAGHHVTISVRNEDELDIKMILDKVSKVSSAYNFKEKPQGSITLLFLWCVPCVPQLWHVNFILLMGVLFGQLPQEKVRLWYINFSAHHMANSNTIILSTEMSKKSNPGPSYGGLNNTDQIELTDHHDCLSLSHF